jgi:hypothetical protein
VKSLGFRFRVYGLVLGFEVWDLGRRASGFRISGSRVIG